MRLLAPFALLLAGCRVVPEPAGPERVCVRPVFLVAADAQEPPAASAALVARQLEWARVRYRELLEGRESFEIAPGAPLVLHSPKTKAEWMATHDGGAEEALLELFAHDRVDRFSCASVYVVLFCGTGHWPGGGARPINGGINTGGAIMVLAGEDLAAPNFQSTLQHELGHAFGLPHVDVYGYDMSDNPSFMSYNPKHHTRGFDPSATPGALIAEDRRALNHATRVFPKLAREPLRVDTGGRELAPIVFLGPMQLAGQPDYTGPSIVE